MAFDLYIIAAGKGSRMGGSIPKALVPITDKPNLTTTLQQMGHKFTNVFVATNRDVQDQWHTYFTELSTNFPELSRNVVNVKITSGRGDGHAVLETIQTIISTRPKLELSDQIVIAWGDVFFPDARIIDELFEQELDGLGLIPVVHEENPYVTIAVDSDNWVTHADYSKLGETHESGYHDQSVFAFNLPLLMETLHHMHDVLDKNGKYITANGEMSLLHAFHYSYSSPYNGSVKAYETKYPTLSFNTIREVSAIQTKIHEQWTSENR
jgi:bifunctional N-acetylglucosamine-1-phosphate-uridyltransferase/glucosamine-1-phosphate-acetyltransferase GlmU-like protein